MAEVGHNQEREAGSEAGKEAGSEAGRVAKSRAETEEAEREAKTYLPLYIAVQNGEWQTLIEGIGVVEGRLVVNGIPIDTSISWLRQNLLHLIVELDGSTKFLRALTGHANFDTAVLLQTDCNGHTALVLAAVSGNTKAATIMVEKNPAVLTIENPIGVNPVIYAAQFGHYKTVEYLLTQTIGRPNHGLDGVKGVLLLNLLITATFYDLAHDLLVRFPNLAYGIDQDGRSPLEIFVQRPLLLQGRIEQHRTEAIRLIRFICLRIRNHTQSPDVRNTASEFVINSFHRAAELGIYEIVVEIINTWPYMVFFMDYERNTIYHLAVQYRHEKNFNLIWNLGPKMHRILMTRNNTTGTNILHLAARLGATTTSRVSGAALQMQRELQWFKEVENITPLALREEIDSEAKTPRMVFTDEHKDLVKAGEEWMKIVATSCTVVAALIVTVAFAAGFTIPGGNDSKGIPTFLHRPSFIVFAISNSLALFSSSSSLIMFLSILTSRYSEIDFLYSLPNKLIIGLGALFLSILCMLIAFSAALYLYLVHLSNYVMIPIIVSTCIPAVMFVFLEFPLLKEIAYSTYGPSIFHHKSTSLTTII